MAKTTKKVVKKPIKKSKINIPIGQPKMSDTMKNLLLSQIAQSSMSPQAQMPSAMPPTMPPANMGSSMMGNAAASPMAVLPTSMVTAIKDSPKGKIPAGLAKYMANKKKVNKGK